MTSMLMTIDTRRPTHEPRERLDSLAQTPTELLSLSPEFLDALRKVAPKVRPRRLPYGLLLVAVAGIGLAVGRRALRHHDVRSSTPVAAATSAAPAPTTASASAAAPSAPPADRATIAPSSAPSALPAAAAPTTIATDDRARPEKSKTNKVRHAQLPH